MAHRPQHFKHTGMISLRKSGQEDYRIPKVYRLRIGKALKPILVIRLSWTDELFNLLLKPYGRKKSPSTLYTFLVESVHSRWSKNSYSSLHSLNVSGGLDKASKPRYVLTQLGKMTRRGQYVELDSQTGPSFSN